MPELGFKKLTLDNWLEPNSFSQHIVRLESDGTTRPKTRDEWVHVYLEPELVETVPEDVQALFEVARGALIYGYFFYPLYTLGTEQLYRVLEAAVTHKCNSLGASAPKSGAGFQKKVNYLIENQIIPQEENMFWNAIVKMRNMASHPERQSINMPNYAVRILQEVANRINFLFEMHLQNS